MSHGQVVVYVLLKITICKHTKSKPQNWNVVTKLGLRNSIYHKRLNKRSHDIMHASFKNMGSQNTCIHHYDPFYWLAINNYHPYAQS